MAGVAKETRYISDCGSARRVGAVLDGSDSWQVVLCLDVRAGNENHELVGTLPCEL